MGVENKVYQMGIIGFGGMATHHYKETATMERINVKGIYDISEAANKRAKYFGLQTYLSIDELLSDNEIDMVLIAVPNHLHKDFAIQALRAGKHVLCEKPVTLSSCELLEVMEVVKETGKIFSINQNRRVNRDFIAMKRAVESVGLEKYMKFNHALKARAEFLRVGEQTLLRAVE